MGMGGRELYLWPFPGFFMAGVDISFLINEVFNVACIVYTCLNYPLKNLIIVRNLCAEIH